MLLRSVCPTIFDRIVVIAIAIPAARMLPMAAVQYWKNNLKKIISSITLNISFSSQRYIIKGVTAKATVNADPMLPSIEMLPIVPSLNLR